MKMSPLFFNAFVQGYIECARESCGIENEDESSPDYEVTFEEGEIEISEKGEQQAIRICKDFVEKAEARGIDLGDHEKDLMESGSNFWLGSMDQDLVDFAGIKISEDREQFEKFKELCEEYEENCLLLDEDRKAYFEHG